MLRVALTGGIASGKTSVSHLFAELGVPVIDTDVIARELVQPGSTGLTRIVRRFGVEILRPDGHLDRRRLRDRIFANPEERQALENILHPAIRQAVIERLGRLDAPYAIVVIPLLLESGQDWQQDRVLLVDSPEELQKKRLIARDNCPPEQAQEALEAQASRTQRLAIADDVIRNEGDLRQLRSDVERLHRRYTEMAAD